MCVSSAHSAELRRAVVEVLQEDLQTDGSTRSTVVRDAPTAASAKRNGLINALTNTTLHSRALAALVALQKDTTELLPCLCFCTRGRL